VLNRLQRLLLLLLMLLLLLHLAHLLDVHDHRLGARRLFFLLLLFAAAGLGTQKKAPARSTAVPLHKATAVICVGFGTIAVATNSIGREVDIGTPYPEMATNVYREFDVIASYDFDDEVSFIDMCNTPRRNRRGLEEGTERDKEAAIASNASTTRDVAAVMTTNDHLL
jgi:hypothetical protein